MTSSHVGIYGLLSEDWWWYHRWARELEGDTEGTGLQLEKGRAPKQGGSRGSRGGVHACGKGDIMKRGLYTSRSSCLIQVGVQS